MTSEKKYLYFQVYEYYKQQITTGALAPGTRMPSLRRCARERSLSRTTIEAAYLQLAADGYLLVRPQSGYYVTGIAEKKQEARKPDTEAAEEAPVRYDFASSGVDRESFPFDLWRRYLKSALRQNDRMLSYGEPQGEQDFRQVLCDYVREKRNVICSPEDIVVGAGVQSLLQILCPLLKKTRTTVSFPTTSFVQGAQIFSDFGFQVSYRNKDCDVIYVSPAHMTKWGDLMPVSRRLELVRYASQKGSIILEDDYENELVYLQKPTPSLFSLSGKENVVYIGSFSRLLLPSIRISFMVLPKGLAEAYREVGKNYNQTASKAEQIALCQYIRDGHLAAQTRKLRKLYGEKMKKLLQAVQEVFGKQVSARAGASGTTLLLTLPYPYGGEQFIRKAAQQGVRITLLQEKEQKIGILLSCSSLPADQFAPGCRILKKILESGA